MTEEFFGEGNDVDPARLQPEQEMSIESWLDAIKRKKIAFLPRVTAGKLYWYAFAPTMREQKELLTLIDAWVGPTFSDLPRSRGRLYPHDPFDTALAADGVPPLRFEVLPRGNGAARDEVRQTLLVLSKLVWNRPRSEFDTPRTTIEVIDDLGHAIAARDRRIALACLRELKASADLDHSNLAFLRIRVYAGLGDTAAIFTDQDLEHVLQLRRPIGITRLLQTAVYDRYLASADNSGDASALLEAATQIPSHLRALATGAPTATRPAVVVEFMLGLLRHAPSPTLERLAGEAETLSPALAESLRQLFAPAPAVVAESGAAPPPEDAEPAPATPFGPDDEIHRLIDEGEFAAAVTTVLAGTATPMRAALLLACFREVEDPQLAPEVAAFVGASGLRETPPKDDAVVRADLMWFEGFLNPQRNLGWHGWFDALEAGNLRDAAIDFNLTSEWATLDYSTAADRLTSLDDEALAQLGDQGGAFMAAHSSLFADPNGAELCERVLAGFAVSEKGSLGVRVQTVALLEYLAATGPAAAVLTSALEWTELIVEAATSAVTASWTVDVLQAATTSPRALALDAKSRLFYHALVVLRPVKSGLSLADIEGLRLVAEELATALPDDFEVQDSDANPAAPYRYLEDAVVVLYSLTESAITRAAQILRRLVPGIDVRTTSEHDGSQQLAALSAHADVFVMVAASAKHAATDFIKEHRGGLPIVQVNSRGSSAILRELAEG
ncbi:protein DpdD [Oerskovia sp. NPDC060338]|uniref:protein DpdD n=1 Tax=Oerskovia sp. NPDC060338 TaxID=3347100 RepID=UPI00365626A7